MVSAALRPKPLWVVAELLVPAVQAAGGTTVPRLVQAEVKFSLPPCITSKLLTRAPRGRATIAPRETTGIGVASYWATIP